ncbi:MAG: 6-bladed beta-propeller [Solirubrobacterales bacterium]
MLSAVLLLLVVVPSASASFQFVKQWGSAGSGNGQFGGTLGGIATGPDGSVYVADTGNQRIEKFSSTGIFSTKWGKVGIGNGQFNGPTSVATNSAGNVYVVDTYNDRIQKFSSSGTFIAKWGSSGSGNGQFNSPKGIAVDSSGNVYVADSTGRIQKFTSSGNFVTSWNGDGDAGRFGQLATDSSGNVYAYDLDVVFPCGSCHYDFTLYLQKFDSSGNSISELGLASGDEHCECEPNPGGIATDSSGNIYLALDSKIQEFDSSFNSITSWDAGGFGELATDSSGDVYDATGNKVKKYAPSSGPPDTTITSGPSGTIHVRGVGFGYSSSDVDVTFECKIDSGPYVSCPSSGQGYAHLADGPHSFSVRSSDPFNTDPTPATRTFTITTASVAISGTTLTVTAAQGVKDFIKVTGPSGPTVQVSDGGSAIHVGAGCSAPTPSREGTTNCSAQIAKIQVTAGDQNDSVANSTGFPSSLVGGLGNDTLLGGQDDDVLNGGKGQDTMKGMNGNDQLLARDLLSDKLINCDGGNTPGHADKADLDKLPKDPASVVQGCETKTRH